MASETLGEMTRRKARECGDRPALVYKERTTSFVELDRESERAARALLARGARAGGRVGYLGKNSDRFFVAWLGAAKAGMVTVPIGWRLTAPEIAFLLDDAGVDTLFVEPAFAELARELAGERALRLVSTEEAAGDAEGWDSWLASGDGQTDELPAVDPAAPVIQLYTSGTTGKPKGAMLSHVNMFALSPEITAAGADWYDWQDGDVSIVAMPVAHISGAGWGLLGVYHGAKSIILPEFDPAEILRLISTERVSKVFLVPAAMQAVLRQPNIGEADFSRLKYVLYGASPIPLPLLQEAVQVFGCGFVQCYGMTETTGTIAALPPEDHDPQGNERMRSAGKAMPGCEIRVVGEGLEPLPPRSIGEVIVRAPTNMLGYWNRDEATREALQGGWMRTGDAGYMDEDGYVFIQDRLKDMIISGGENVYPAEVESVLYGHPEIADVAVIGVPDERWGEAVTAVVVPKGDTPPDPAAVLAWARERLASYKVPKTIHFKDVLPRNPSGKILRRELREPFWAGRERAVN